MVSAMGKHVLYAILRGLGPMKMGHPHHCFLDPLTRADPENSKPPSITPSNHYEEAVSSNTITPHHASRQLLNWPSS